MDNIFGLPMTTLMTVTLVIMALCLVTVGIIALRNQVIFKMAIRNIPRRKAQTVLIMVGLMLSTLIIAASLTTGDTLDYSIKRSTYQGLGQTDITIAFVGETDDEGQVSVNNQPVPASIADDIRAQYPDDADVNAVMPMLTIAVPVVNLNAQLSEPSVLMTGVDPAQLDGFGGINTPDGSQIDFPAITGRTTTIPADLAAQLQLLPMVQDMGIDVTTLPVETVVISEDLADEVKAQEGDTLVFFYENQPIPISVGAIADGSILTGFDAGSSQSSTLLGISVPLERLQMLTGLEGQARYIAVSTSGGVDNGADRTEAAMGKLETALASVEGGDQLGINPIKEDAIKGAEAFGNIFMSLFLVLGLFSAAAGVLLIFLIFTMLAAERRSEMGMARAVGMKRRHLIQGFIAEGAAYDLGAAFIGAAAGVGVAFIIAKVMGQLIGEFFTIQPIATPQSLIVAYALGVTVTFLTIVFASFRSSRLNIVQAIRDLPEHSTKQHLRPVRRSWRPDRVIRHGFGLFGHYIGWSPVVTVLGLLMLLSGVLFKSTFLFSVGLAVASLGLAVFLRRWLPERAVFTFFAAVNLAYYLIPFSLQEKILPDIGTGGFEMFFVSGLAMVTFATLIIMWNADLLVTAAALPGRWFSRWMPAIKTAVAYPLAAKGRTGLTIAMFSMVIFSLVCLTTINTNFIELFTSDEADAGYDISIITNSANPITDLREQLAGSDVDVERISAVGRVATVAYGNAQMRNPGDDEWKTYPFSGLDADFITNGEVPLEARAPGFESDQAVWDALLSGENVAVVDSNAFAGDGFGSDPSGYFAPDGVDIVDNAFPAFTVEMQSARTGAEANVEVIGVIDAKISMLFGFYTSQQVQSDLFGGADATTLFVQLTEHGAEDSPELAQDMEAALLTSGVQAESISELIEEQQAFFSGFFMLLQGFMGLGLFVGIAALGVISFRSVVERRQQIGMLRAIGYQRNMVAMSFLLESVVVAALGVISGTILAVVLSYNLVMSDDFSEGQDFSGFVVPWGTIAFFIISSLVAAAVMTWVPARKAASVPIAEALRYE